jgi:hypothetical protein
MTREEFNTAVRERGLAAAYGEATGREDWAAKLDEMIPGYMQSGVVWWIVAGIVPGHFLRAVIEGDLYEAVGRADDLNMARLVEYVRFFYNYSPSGCFSRKRDPLNTWKGVLTE